MMRKITAIQIAIIFILGLIPILWLREGYIISNGDNIPASLNAAKAISSTANMWSPDFLGYASPTPSYLLNTYLAAFLSDLGLSVGVVQIIFQILLYMGAGFSMYYFTRKIYPNHDLAPFFASLFYMLNFFILMSRFNLGFAWTYAFLPLILALFFVSVNAACRHDKKTANLGIIGFALVSIVSFSIASVNPANIALFLISIAVLAVYLFVKYRKALVPFSLTLGQLGLATFLVNIWWLLPMINTFFLSPQSLGASVNVSSWSWTHQRASFLNLFWLNGTWGWNTYYIPKSLLDWYANPVVGFLMFVPFILAGTTLLFKSNKSRFNAFIALCILVFVFLAKGLYYGDNISSSDLRSLLSWLNLALYKYFPLMNMFREPVSKFTLIIIPFLALLIGFTADRIIKMDWHFRPKITKSLKIIFVVFMVASFVISALPIFKIPANFVDTYTPDLPYSSYIQIPHYWFQATDWINNQPGNYKVLLTPLDDFYEMPYLWGYYGTDVLIERLFEKPIVSTSALNGYISNPDPAADIAQIRTAVKYNCTNEFKALLDLLNIKYIVQRNDVNSSFTSPVPLNDVQNDTDSRDIKSPSEMQSFFAQQPYLKLVKAPDGQDFGKLDIYEYKEAKPSLFTILPSTLQKVNVHINSYSSIEKVWDFSNNSDVEEWRARNPSSPSYAINQKESGLEVNMSSSTSSWIKVNSPLLPAEIEKSYQINVYANSTNIRRTDVKITEYSADMTPLNNSTFERIYGEFDSNFTHKYNLDFQFEPENSSIKFFSVQFWNYFDPTKNGNSSLWFDDVGVNGTTTTLNMTGLDNIYSDMEQNQAVLQITSSSPTKITAAVNATQPFILATTQSMDKSWVATVTGMQILPISTYLGLKGFMINQTGQFDVTIEYKPQQWFNYSLIISGVTVLFLCIAILYLQRTQLKGAYQKIRKPKS